MHIYSSFWKIRTIKGALVHNKNGLLFLLALLILVLPNLITAAFSIDSIVATPLKKTFFVLYGVSFYSLMIAFIRPKLLFILLLPVVFVSFIEIYVVITLKSGINEGLFATFFSTNMMEVSELLMSNKIFLTLALCIFIGYTFILASISLKYALSFKLRISLACFFLFIQLLIISRDFKIAMRVQPEERLELVKYYSYVKLSKTFPVSWLMNLNNFVTMHRELTNYEKKINGFKFGAVENEPTSQPKLIVMVIGETARRHNFSLYGYERETNPLLKTEANLIVLNRAETLYNLTERSYPIFLSRATKEKLSIRTDEPSVLKAFQEAGFKTVYINNQSLGYGSIYYQYAHQADTLIDLKPSLDRSCNDDTIIDVFKNVVKSHWGDKVFVVIHSLGSHFRYNLRYPQDYEVFKPAIDNGLDLASIDNGIKEELRNSYDNSILFTDHFLDGLISILKSDSSSVSLMLYASDHGENIFDDGNNMFAHGGTNMTKYEKEIPLMIWHSDSYNEVYGYKIQNILSHVNSNITTSNFFHSILDLAGVTIDNQTLSNSFASRNFSDENDLRQRGSNH